MRDLGELGQDIFKYWCTQVGLIANPSLKDTTGWDFHIETPHDFRSLDREVHSSPIEYRVQVKATDKRDRKLAIPLSNLRRMATTLIPTYYIFIEFDGKNEAQNVFLVHVDNNLVSKVLKKLHTNEQKDKPSPLNKVTLTINYGEEHRLAQATSENLLLGLNKPIKNDLAKYMADKSEYLKNAGYDELSYSLSFSLDTDEFENLLNSSLGLNSSAKVTSVIGTKKRFGVSNKTPEIEHESGVITFLSKPYSTGSVIFKEDSLSIGIRFDVDVYTPFTYEYLTPEQDRFRIKGELFEMFIYTKLNQVELTFNLSGEACLQELAKTLKLIQLYSSSKSGFICEVILTKLEKEFRLNIGKTVEYFPYQRSLIATEDALKIIHIHEFNEEIKVSLPELVSMAVRYNSYRKFLEEENKTDRENVCIETAMNETSDKLDESKDILSIACVFVNIGKFVFGVVISVSGSYKRIKNGHYLLESNKIKHERKFVINADCSSFHEDILNYMNSIADKYSEKTECVVVHDPSKSLPSD